MNVIIMKQIRDLYIFLAFNVLTKKYDNKGMMEKQDPVPGRQDLRDPQPHIGPLGPPRTPSNLRDLVELPGVMRENDFSEVKISFVYQEVTVFQS